MRFGLFREKRFIVDGEICKFRFHMFSPDNQYDVEITQSIRSFDRGDMSQTAFEIAQGRIQNEIQTILRVYLPSNVQMREYSIDFGGSATITFALVFAGAVSIYDAVSKYDSFRKGLDRIRDEVSKLLGRIARQHNKGGPLIGDNDWTPGRLLIELEEMKLGSTNLPLFARPYQHFVSYLIVQNIVLGLLLVLLLWNAVRIAYFYR